MSLLLALQSNDITGSGSSSVLFVDAGMAQVIYLGSGISAVAFTDAGSALVIYQGSGASVVVFTDSGSGTVESGAITGSGASIIVFDDQGFSPRAFVLDGGGPPPPKDHVPGKPRRYRLETEPFELAPDFDPLRDFGFGYGRSELLILSGGEGGIAWGEGQDEDDVLTLLALVGEL